MRKELFKKNYRLLKKFAPEMLTDAEPCFWLNHVSNISKYCNSTAERQGDSLIIGTSYDTNGDFTSDPSITVIFDNELKMARVSSLVMNNMGMCLMGTAFYEWYECSIDSEEKCHREREANDYLTYWLSEFSVARNSDPNYFTVHQDDVA